jgi:hypothetical protein
MSDTGLVIIGMSVLLIAVILLFGRGEGGRLGPARLAPLSNESRDRYLMDWKRLETRFLEAPVEAAREADAVVISVLRERGHPLGPRELPRDVREARREASATGRDQTEGLRRAMLRYRAVVERMVGTPLTIDRDREGRREMA